MTKAERYIAFVDEQLRARARRPDGWPRWTDLITVAPGPRPPREPRDRPRGDDDGRGD